MAAKRQYEYYVRRKKDTFVGFEVSKFDSMTGGNQPVATYNVTYDHVTGKGKCDCPAGTYRGTGPGDKHVKMVREWILAGEKTTAILA